MALTTMRCGQATRRLHELAPDFIPWLELPPLDVPIVGLLDDDVPSSTNASGENGTPHIDVFIEKANEDLPRVHLANGRSPTSGPGSYLASEAMPRFVGAQTFQTGASPLPIEQRQRPCSSGRYAVSRTTARATSSCLAPTISRFQSGSIVMTTRSAVETSSDTKCS